MSEQANVFRGLKVSPTEARKRSKAEQSIYLRDLERRLEQGLAPSFNEAVTAIVSEFIALGYPLQGVAAEKDCFPPLLNLSFRAANGAFLLAFDVCVSVFFADQGEDLPSTDSMWEVPLKEQYRPESWETLSKNAAMPGGSRRANNLQTYVESRLTTALEDPMATMASQAEALGCEMRQQRSRPPEIDYRDGRVGLHFGITCIGTVSC